MTHQFQMNKNNMRKVLVFGTFDCIHRGHIALFETAKSYGDHLTVVISRDATVKKHKPVILIHTEQERQEIVSHIDLIDEVLLGDITDPYARISEVKPDVIALGYDQTLFVDELESELAKRGITAEIIRIPAYDASRVSTTQLRTIQSKNTKIIC